MASLTTPVALEASIDSAPTSTVGMLFITDDSRAESTPVPMAAPQTPPWAKRSRTDAIEVISPALRNP